MTEYRKTQFFDGDKAKITFDLSGKVHDPNRELTCFCNPDRCLCYDKQLKLDFSLKLNGKVIIHRQISFSQTSTKDKASRTITFLPEVTTCVTDLVYLSSKIRNDPFKLGQLEEFVVASLCSATDHAYNREYIRRRSESRGFLN